MELIYLYIGDVDRPLRFQGIRFGSGYYAEYDRETRKLTIDRREDSSAGLYGPRIKSLDLVVGKNGTGKTTAFELLGLPKQDRVNAFPMQTRENAWFALYHIKGDRFALEGYDIDAVDFAPYENHPYFQPVYSAEFRYDVSTHRMLTPPDYLQDLKASNRDGSVTDELFYISYQSPAEYGWYSASRRSGIEDTGWGFMFHRIVAQHIGLSGVLKYLYASVHDRQFASKMSSKPETTIRIELHQEDKRALSQETDYLASEKDAHRIAAQHLYGGKEALLDPLDPRFDVWREMPREERYTKAQSMTIIYLEEIACYWLMQDKPLDERPYEGDGSYESRKEHLLELISRRNGIDGAFARAVTQGIEEIPDEYFTKGTTVEIRLSDMTCNFLTPLMEALDDNQEEDEHEINHHYYIRVSFVGLSTGEAQYLDLFASLYNAIRRWQYKGGSTCILLLDEPDHRFHPEWSRNFIANLTEMLETEEFFRQYDYQIIISTHSPLLLSDVPRKHIHCLQRDGESGLIRVLDSDYGFMSSLNDLLVDSFFSDSVFGAFAEGYVNRLIDDLNALEEEADGTNYGYMQERISELNRRLEIVEDKVIHGSLMQRINRLERRARRSGNDPHQN